MLHSSYKKKCWKTKLHLKRMGRGRRGGGGEGVEGRGTGKIVYSCLKLSGIDRLNRFNFRIIQKNYEIGICFVQ